MSLDVKTAFLLLGTNLGNREQNLSQAIELIGARVGTVLDISARYETAAWGKSDQPSFLNQALKIKSQLAAVPLLEELLRIEADLGRVRLEKWGARLIDIDLIFYGAEVINIEQKLQVPHPEMHKRRFVLQPLVELEPAFVHPVFNKTLKQLLIDLKDDLAVVKC